MKRLLLILTALFAVAAYGQEPYSIRMIRSEMQRNPDATYLDGREGQRKWNYTTGLELKSFLDAAKRYELPEVVEYVRAWADTMATEKGEIYSYKKSNYNVDHICPARIYFDLHDMYGDQDKRYRRVTRKVREQLDSHPRTQSGEFWHKQVYPHQVWLDGVYMASPFYTEYAVRYLEGEEQTKVFDEVVTEFEVAAKYTFDPETRLYRHAWDESKSMFWCDPQTGQSQHCWGRALGWYVIAAVDVLDYLPEDYAGREQIINILKTVCAELPKWADKESGVWYQVLDQPGREGNYLEATCSAMFSYAYLKAVRLGYIDESYRQYAIDLYQDVVDTFISTDEQGRISLEQCCSVGGLGGSNNRMGDYAYYLSEPVRPNDSKGVGPFIWASLEMEQLN